MFLRVFLRGILGGFLRRFPRVFPRGFLRGLLRGSRVSQKGQKYQMVKIFLKNNKLLFLGSNLFQKWKKIQKF